MKSMLKTKSHTAGSLDGVFRYLFDPKQNAGMLTKEDNTRQDQSISQTDLI